MTTIARPLFMGGGGGRLGHKTKQDTEMRLCFKSLLASRIIVVIPHDIKPLCMYYIIEVSTSVIRSSRVDTA